MGAMGIVLAVAGLILMTELNVSDEEKQILINHKVDDDQNEDDLKPGLSVLEALKSKNVILLIIINSFTLIPMNVFSVNYKNYGEIFIEDDKFLTRINTIGAVVNIPARMVWGLIVDRISFKMTYLIILALNSVLLFTVCFNEYIGDKYIYMLYFIMSDLFIVGALLIMPQVYVKSFGQKNIFMIHGLVQLFGVGVSFIVT